MGEIVNNNKEHRSPASKDLIRSKESAKSIDPIQLKRKVTLLNAITLVAGSIIGSGIFISPKGVFENCGQSAVISLLAWAFCGLFSLIGALSFAELGRSTMNSNRLANFLNRQVCVFRDNDQQIWRRVYLYS